MTIDAPRSIPDPDPRKRIGDNNKDHQRRTKELERGAPQRSMAISDDTGAGIRADETGFYTVDAAGNVIGIFQTADGAFVIQDSAATPMARFGPLLSDPGNFGGEIWDDVNSVWVKLVTGASTSWAAITGKPATFTPTAHTHAGSDVTSAVALADGSAYAFNNNVAGTTFYAVWVGNDGGNHLGKNTSSMRYKQNVRPYAVDPEKVLQLEPKIFDRKPVRIPTPEGQEGPDQMVTGATDEYGLIAEEVHELVPEIVVWYEGEIDGIRYDLLALALLDVAKDQDRQLNEQDDRLAALEAAVIALGGTL
ncbi:tail fiber domain-containing protein [Pseudarthrobacter sp. CCNWLW207]|uniref:tail fiber domain-containing protein n=1 Tax=Pseudarthrobacter sp. CCNWLW207 TaxID=3127468 RepID=UPI003076EF0C